MKIRALFHELKHGDPKAIAVMSVIVFLATSLWFSWNLYASSRRAAPEIGEGRVRTPQPTPTPLSTFVLAQQELKVGEDPPNPFHLPYVRRRPPVRPDRGDRTERPDPPVRPPPPPRPDPEPEPPPPPPRETVTYVYRGMIRRPDGNRAAMVHNPRTGNSMFLQAGAALPPLTVVNVDTETLELAGEDDMPVILNRGEPQTFTLPE
ncbi:MAG: hypothetical protein JJU29_11330 [Verrucomicrobia bacterium]|nr:hypothetical protein [Verrucomicrobiota bacterium]MCH8513004.1 hypothetical protein [Kiritimatiellia bacterium]